MGKYFNTIALSIFSSVIILLVVAYASFGATNSGQAAYNQYCASCHDTDGSGTGNGPNIRGDSITLTTDATRQGPSSMPAFSASVISDSQLNDLARYVRYSLTTGGDVTAPVVSNIQPSTFIGTNSATLYAYLSDSSGSGINSATSLVYLDGSTVSGCSRTSSLVSCSASGLAEGSHTIFASVKDNAAWEGYNSGSFTVDTVAPTVSDILPSGTVSGSSATVTAYYADFGSGINPGSIEVYLDGTVLNGCSIGASTVSCSATGLSAGTHAIIVSVDDNAGHGTSGNGSFTVTASDGTAPSVTNISPSGTIGSSSATVYAYFSDAGSGIDAATAAIYLDGSGTAMTGCTASATSISCPATGLADGAHTISVSVSDNAGNTGTSSGGFTVSTGGGSCTTDYTDANGATIAVYSDSGYTNKVCQQTQLSANTDYYMQITHPGMNLSSEGTGTNRMRVYNMMNSQVNFGNGANEVAFSQQSGGAPYRYRATFRTPGTAGVYGLQPDVQNNTGTKRVYARGWNIRVGATGNYVRTYTDAGYSEYSDTYSAGSNVYMEIFDSAFTDGTPSAGQSTLTLGTDWNSGTSTLSGTYSHPGARIFRVQLTLPASAGDKYIYARVRDSGGANLAGYVRTLIHVTAASDSTAPAVTNVSPSGTINSSSATVYAYYSDAGSGIDTASAAVFLDGSGTAMTGCTATAASISCPATGLADGAHTISVSVSDNAGNAGTGNGSFSVDTAVVTDSTPPSITGIEPVGTINTASATVSAYYSDSDSGIDSASVRVYLDGAPLGGCTVDTSSASCPAAGLAQGAHTITVYVDDNEGNTATDTGGFTVDTSPGADTTAPVVTGTTPGGSVRAHSATIVAYFNDGAGTGIDPASVSLTLNGTPINGCTVASNMVTCELADLAKGRQTVVLSLTDLAGNPQTATWSFTTAGNYYWTWYDCVSAKNWVLMSNSLSGPDVMDFDLAIERNDMDLSPFAVGGYAPGQIPRGSSITPMFNGLMNGPVIASSLTGDSAIVSQRSIWKGWEGGNSIEEVPGIDEDRLSSHYYWTWYDMLSPGYKNWVLVANPNDYAVWYRIKIAGQVKASGRLPEAGQPGNRVTPMFPGVMAGPVEVEAAADQYFQNPANVIASQRVLMNNDDAFSETPGIPAEELSDRYLWTWYDMQSPGATNWILVANPDPSVTVSYQIAVGSNGCDADPNNRPAGSACRTGTLNPAGQPDGSDRVNATFPGIIGGPVEVTARVNGSSTPAKVIASQRVIWGPSFGEVPGMPAGSLYESLSSDYHWTWYDMQSPQSVNWVLVANPGASPLYYSVRIAGVERASGTLQPAGSNGDRITPVFPGVMGGPVEVRAWSDAGHTVPADVIASQRYIWAGYFNEVLGTILE